MSPYWQTRFWTLSLISVPIIFEDLRARRIPNWSCCALLVAGIATSAVEAGFSGVLWSIGGAAAGFAVFLLFYLLGGMGAGDIKLMAACGSLLGLRELPLAAMLTAIAGAAIALTTIGIGALRRKREGTIPYGPAIIAGALLTLLGRAG